MTDQAMLSEKARPLARRLKNQTGKYLEACKIVLSGQEQLKKEPAMNTKAALAPVTAFQMVHVASLMASKQYMQPTQIDAVNGVFAETLYGPPDDKWINFLQKYEENKQLDLSNQLLQFSEDVAVAMLGSAAGMAVGSPLAIMAKEFYIRNMGLVAEHFGDKETRDVCIKAIKDIHTPPDQES